MDRFDRAGQVSDHGWRNFDADDIHTGLTPPALYALPAQTSCFPKLDTVDHANENHLHHPHSRIPIDGIYANGHPISGPVTQADFSFDGNSATSFQYSGPAMQVDDSEMGGAYQHQNPYSVQASATASVPAIDWDSPGALDAWFNKHRAIALEDSARTQARSTPSQETDFDQSNLQPSLPLERPPISPVNLPANAEQHFRGESTDFGEEQPQLSESELQLQLIQLIQAERRATGASDAYQEPGSSAAPPSMPRSSSDMQHEDTPVGVPQPVVTKTKAKRSARFNATHESAQLVRAGKARNHLKVKHDASLKPEHASLTGAELLDGRIDPGDISGELLLHIGETQRNVDIANALNKILRSQGKKEVGRNLIAQRVQDAIKAKYGVGEDYEAGRRLFNDKRKMNKVKVFEEGEKGFNLAYQAKLFKKGQKTKKNNRDQHKRGEKRSATTAELDDPAESDGSGAAAPLKPAARGIRKIKDRKLDPNRASNFPIEDAEAEVPQNDVEIA